MFLLAFFKILRSPSLPLNLTVKNNPLKRYIQTNVTLKWNQMLLPALGMYIYKAVSHLVKLANKKPHNSPVLWPFHL